MRNMEPFYFAPQSKFGGGWIAFKDSPSPPPPPDYVGAATAQGAANKDAAIAGAQISNPNITNPFGSQTVTYQNDPVTGNPVPYVNQSLSPIGQQRFDQNQRIDTGLGNLAETGLGYVQNALNVPFDQSNLPARTVNAGQTGQDAIMARLEPQMQRRTDALENKLVNQGLVRGSEAFTNAMSDQGMIDNDLLTQASLQGISLGDQARSKAIQEESFFRNEPLNILNAVRSASPVGMPQFQNYTGQSVAPAPVFQGTVAQGQANQAAYNAQQANDAMFMQGLMGLGGGLAQGIGSAGGFGAFFSDRRLKRDIERIGTHPSGIGLYEYSIFGRREVGVMADEVLEVMPEAVHTHESGYLMVDYGRLNAP